MNLALFHTLVPALLHTPWIGLIAALILFGALKTIPTRKATVRYTLSVAALLAILLGGLRATKNSSSQYLYDSAQLDCRHKVRVWKEDANGKATHEFQSEWFFLSKSKPIKELTCVLKPTR